MTNSKHTKRALLASVLSVVLCAAMLVGGTFAWFTDSVTSGRNKIVAGNLDIELYKKDAGGYTEAVTETTKLFDDSILWEPGHVEVVNLKIANLGSLATKYQFAIKVENEVVGKSVLPGNPEIKLSEHLKFGVIFGDEETAFDTREAAIAAVEATATNLAAYSKEGKLAPAGNETVTFPDGITAADEAYVTLVVYMPETVGNEANHLAGDENIPFIEMGVQLIATQVPLESDSFGPDYDADADASIHVNPSNVQEYLDGKHGSISGMTLVLDEGEYDQLYLRQSLQHSTRRPDLDRGPSYPAYLFEFSNVTIKAANRNVICKGIKAEAGLFFFSTAPASNQDEMGKNTGFISYLALKNITIDGITFENHGIDLRDNKTFEGDYSTILVNNLTVTNCTGNGSGETNKHFFKAGSGTCDKVFPGTKLLAFNNITIDGNMLNRYYQPICWNNSSAVLNGLAVTNNQFNHCTNNNLQIGNKENKGAFVFSGNTITGMSGRFIRMANVKSEADITISDNTVIAPVEYGSSDEIVKITGDSGFAVTSSGNDWEPGEFNASGNTWIETGDASLLPTNP